MTDTDPLDAPHRTRPLPLVPVLLGVAVLAAAALILPSFAPPLPRMTLVGAGAAVGIVFWLLALAAGLRRGPGWWTAASLALLVAAGALAGLNAARITHAGGSHDASTFAELGLTPEATPILPSNPARGPISSAYVELVRADEAAARDQSAQLSKLNLGALNSPYLLDQAPAILRDCSAIGALATAAEQAGKQRAERIAALSATIEAARLSAEVKQGIATLATPPDGATEALIAQDRELWQATQSLCELLARRGWSNANGYFGFANPADKATFDALNQRRLKVEAERKRIRDATKARFEAGREQVRAALS